MSQTFEQQFWTVFHRAWSAEVGKPGYDKRAWGHVQLRIEHAIRTDDRTSEAIREAMKR